MCQQTESILFRWKFCKQIKMLFYNHFLVHKLLYVCCGREKKLNPWMQLEILSIFRTFLQATNFKNFIRTSLAYVMHMLCFRKKHMRKLNIWHMISDVYFHLRKDSLRQKCPKTEFFLVRSFPHSDWIRRDTSHPDSDRMRENTDQKKLCIWTLFTLWLRISL